MTRRRWNSTPFDACAYRYDGGMLARRWRQLHQGDLEPFPAARWLAKLAEKHRVLGAWVAAHDGSTAAARALQNAWQAFHAGEFGRAVELGSELGPLGAVVASKAAAVYVLHLEPDKARAVAILEAAIKRAERARGELPDHPNVHCALGLLLGRYSQRISIVRALADGLASRVRTALERTLELAPRHAEAHIALGVYHAEIVGRLGALTARLTYQASRNAAVEHFKLALKLAPTLPIARIEYANGLLLLDREGYRDEAHLLYRQAASCEPLDAMQRLDVERAIQLAA